ncbi:hypothetical protein TRIUR3_28952 [Triticum urartu]|uniref:PLAT domain-containing protein n=1 Tax=Triticum urartu TaxID=4572 RepID=M7ZC75_TRIUA|nr:hypothetical protein TRIUR3_28952 [Triticum urartu]
MAMAIAKLALLILAAAFLAGTSNGLAEYRLVVKTKKGTLSGTESLVVFELYDSSGGAGVIRLIDGDGPTFNSDSLDTFTFYEAKGNEPCHLGLRIFDSAENTWRPESVNPKYVTDMGHPGTADAAARAAAEEAIHTHIGKKRQWRNTHALAREQNRVVRAMLEMPPREEKDDSDGEDSSGDV